MQTAGMQKHPRPMLLVSCSTQKYRDKSHNVMAFTRSMCSCEFDKRSRRLHPITSDEMHQLETQICLLYEVFKCLDIVEKLGREKKLMLWQINDI